nr:MAG TPA: hypothetical protein [Caudoviricetes sp.]
MGKYTPSGLLGALAASWKAVFLCLRSCKSLWRGFSNVRT